jgi:hypothetical protein
METSQKQIINDPSCSCHKGLDGTGIRSKAVTRDNNQLPSNSGKGGKSVGISNWAAKMNLAY